MAVRAAAVPRALARPRQVDARIVAAVFLGLIGLVGNLAVLGTLAPAEHEVVVAARDLPAGATLGPGDVVRARVQVPDEVLAGLIPGDQAGQLIGRTLAERVHAHELLGQAGLAAPDLAPGPGQLQVELPMRPESAVVGTLQPGDVVTVMASLPPGKADAAGHAGAYVVVPRARVAAARPASTNSGARGGLAAVVLTVSRDEALALTDAQANATLTIALAGTEPEP
jgi:Flp pilus assembly protein CpaB